MADGPRSNSGYLHWLSFLLPCCGLIAGLVFFLLARLTLPQVVFPPFFWVAALGLGLLMGGFFYVIVRMALKQQLRDLLGLLKGLTGNLQAHGSSATVEDFSAEVQRTAQALQSLVSALKDNLDQASPRYQVLSDVSRYLIARAKDGQQAAEKARADVEGMFEKQQSVMGQVSALTDQAQDEAAISRELSASLVEIAGALEHSTRKFLETTRSVDELVDSIQDSSLQADQVVATMDGTAGDLDSIGDAFNELRSAVENSALKANTVKQNAEQGLKVVEPFMQEMNRIDESGRQAMTAMQRLARQTDEATKIIEVIKGLVSDTELLAFNAAIIAAKAGAEGRGFLVVADEMRELADRTTSSAGEIEEIVRHIREDTGQVSSTIEATSRFIARGMTLSQSTGDAFSKIVASSQQAAAQSQGLAGHSEEQRARVRKLIEDAGSNLLAVRAITRNMQEQESAIGRVQSGVSEMKSAADQIARGVDEQVKANQEFDQSMHAREEQVRSIFEATRFQMETVERIFEHFNKSSDRLESNAEKSKVILEETSALEELVVQLRGLVKPFQN